jgi:arylsulfatase A-like enzyme
MNVDLPSTILKAAGAKPRRAQDGIPLQRAMERPGALRERDIVIETGRNTFDLPYYSGLRTARYRLEVVTTGEVELYDLRKDPFELQSVHDDPRYAGVLAALTKRLEKLKGCRGSACASARGKRLR